MRDKKILLLFILFTIVATYRAPMVEAQGCLAGQCSGGQKQVCAGKLIDRTCETVTCENIGNAGDCQNTGCTWTPQCCDFSNASSRTYRVGNGYCSTSCGGGTCIYDAGSGNWQRTSCNTQSCTSPLPNCANLAGPSQITIGQSGTYTADHFSPQGSLRGTIDVGQNGQFLASNYPGVAPSGNSGSSSFTWTPTMVGTYDILCRSWNDAIAECRGKSNYVDGPPRYTCSGPNSSMTINVVSVIPPTVALPTPTCIPRQQVQCFREPCETILVCPTTPPAPTCRPRPACLDSFPRCLLEPAEGWCPQLTPTPAPTEGATCDNSTGDADCNSKVDLADFELWRKEFTGEAKTKKANFSKSGKTSLTDFEIWRVNFFK